MLKVPRKILAATFEQLRLHGRGQTECVVYWMGSANTTERVDEMIHPLHTCRFGGYQIDSKWLTDFWFDLGRRRKSVRVQVHTHPHEAFHSRCDDDWALLPDAGFLSLVIPNFALGEIGFKDAYLAERTADGTWAEVPTEERILIDE